MSDPGSGRGRDGLDPAQIAELREAVSAVRDHIHARLGRDPGDESPDLDPVEATEDADRGTLVDDLLEHAASIDWMRIFQDLRQRFSALGIDESSASVDDFGFDEGYVDRMRPLLDFLYRRWWRVQVSGEEGIPFDRPVLFVANRAGILPYDGLMLAHAVEKTCAGRRPRFLVADWLLRIPFSQPLLARVGGVRACAENAERLLTTGRWVASFPEGQKGALKPYRDRYRLQRFARGGFVSIAIRAGAVIVPTAVIGSEEVHPILLQSRFLDRLLGLPVPVTPTFPLLGPLGLLPLPSHWGIHFGEPIDFAEIPRERAEDPLYVNRIRERVRGSVQSLVDGETRTRRRRQDAPE